MQACTALLKCQGECTKEVLLWQNMGHNENRQHGNDDTEGKIIHSTIHGL